MGFVEPWGLRNAAVVYADKLKNICEELRSKNCSEEST